MSVAVASPPAVAGLRVERLARAEAACAACRRPLHRGDICVSGVGSHLLCAPCVERAGGRILDLAEAMAD